MGIKEVSVSYRSYFKTMRASVRPKYEEAVALYEKKLVEEKTLYSDIKLRLETYKSTYKINLMDYDEFVKNSYTTGIFYDACKTLFINRKKNYVATSPSYTLYKLARLQKEVYDLKHQIDIYEKMLDITMEQYRSILEAFYTEVHKHMIINGEGYVFEEPLGWVCINRCKIVKGRNKKLDFKATKENKEKLIAEGKRLWNKEEAEYARSIGVEYKGVDYRVYLNAEAVYEIPIINCRLSRDSYRFYIPYARRHTTGKSEEELIALCNNDKEKICELNTDLKMKLKLCLKVDDLLYLNFIRNDAQQSAHTPKANRKS